MAKSSLTDEDFIRLYLELGASGLSKYSGINERNIRRRRRLLEEKTATQILNPSEIKWSKSYPHRTPISIENGTIVAFSDAHYWPGVVTTAHLGLVEICKRLQPDYIIANGDVFDGARISRHDRIGWAQSPTVKQELEVCQDRLMEVNHAAPKAKLHWTLGNHDLRLDTYLSKQAGEMEGVLTGLPQHFPHWEFSTSIWINGEVVVKHRYKGGDHATHNNTIRAGMTIITGHLHSLKVTPYSDYTGLRFGVDTGTLTDPASDKEAGPQTEYNEDNPQNHRSGFVVLTFKDGILLWPEIAYVLSERKICFRGQVINV